MDIKQIINLNDNEKLGLFRKFITEEKSLFINGNYVWIFLIKNSLWDCLRDWLSYDNQQLQTINEKDEYKRGWCHYCIYHNVPIDITTRGISKLDNSWNNEDIFGIKPIEAFPNHKIAQIMAKKYWNENFYLSPIKKREYFFNLYNSIDNKDKNLEKLKRVWLFWSKN